MGDSFKESFSSGLQSGNELFLPILGIIFFIILLFILYKIYKKINFSNFSLHSFLFDKNTATMPLIKEFNPLQRKVLFELIAEYKKDSLFSQNIPDAEYELFSEWLFKNSNKLLISKNDIKKLQEKFYPLLKNTKIEIDFTFQDKHYIVETIVTDTNTNYITAKFVNITPVSYEKGLEISINYVINSLFISGQTSLKSIIPGKQLIFFRPKQFKVTNERRYQRYSMDNLNAILISTWLTEPLTIQIMDLSPEGLKIQSEKQLKKNFTYKISFSEEIDSVIFNFENIRCYISKSFISNTGYYEYGMLFFFTIEDKYKLHEYLKRYITTHSIKRK